MKTLQSKSILFFILICIVLAFSAGVVLGRDNEQQSSFATPILVVNASFLNVRTGPGVQYAVLVTVVGGTELPVIGIASDKVWYQVNTDAGVGWVNVSFTLPRGEFRYVPVIRLSDLDAANLGQGGGGVAPVGTSTNVASSNRLWGLSVIGGDLRDGPSDNARKLRIAVGPDLNNVYPLVNETFNEGRLWYQTNIPGIGAVWNEAHQFRVRPLICFAGQSAGVAVEDGGLGGGPDGTSSPGITVSVGDEFHILDAREGLAKVQLFDGSQGWLPIDKVAQRSSNVVSYCAGVSPTSASASNSSSGSTTNSTTPAITAPARVVINTGNLNIRSGPSAGFSVVATVAGGTELAVIGRAPDGVWYLVEGSFGQGWLNNQFVLFRGSYSAVPVVDIRNMGN